MLMYRSRIVIESYPWTVKESHSSTKNQSAMSMKASFLMIFDLLGTGKGMVSVREVH